MKTFQKTILIGLALAALTPVRADQDELVKSELKALAGEWSMVSGSADGQPMPEDMRKQMKRVCQGDELTVTMGAQIFVKAKITIDPSKKPKTIDYQMTDGFSKGKKQLGIYELEGDTLKSAFGKPDAERPADFTSKPGDGRTVSVWKRQKPSESKPK
jgi:uncharacterized protein (TIGR03067 family)